MLKEVAVTAGRKESQATGVRKMPRTVLGDRGGHERTVLVTRTGGGYQKSWVLLRRSHRALTSGDLSYCLRSRDRVDLRVVQQVVIRRWSHARSSNRYQQVR